MPKKPKVIELANQTASEVETVANWLGGEHGSVDEEVEAELVRTMGVELMACLRGLERYLRELAEDMRKADESHLREVKRKPRRRSRH